MTSQGVLKKALMKMSKRAMAGAFMNWAESAEEAQELRGKLRMMMKRAMNSAMAGVFDRWAEMSEEAKRMRVILTKVGP